MPLVQILRRHPHRSVGTAVLLSLAYVFLQAWPARAGRFAVIGAQGWGSGPAAMQGPRLSVFETDAWQHSLNTGTLRPVAQLPLPRPLGKKTELLRGARFTPADYLEQIKAFREAYSHQRDILMYFGGIRRRPAPNGLNFNAWSGTDLRKLRALECRPFIGLETMDPTAIRALAWRLKEAGYGPLHRIYVRIGAEPSFSPYGTEDGTPSGKRRTPVAYAAYQKRFAQAAQQLNGLNRRLGLNIHIVFAGASREDFTRYMPSPGLFDAIGYDLYVTPENKGSSLLQLRDIAKRYPYKPLVLPEFGLATEGPARTAARAGKATPAWAADALGDILRELSRHPAGVHEITVFSVNVSGRRRDRRWNWAWTPQMYEMLKEWQTSPRTWRKDGFHRYNPESYPVGKDVLFLNRPHARIVYRKLAEEKSPGVPLFQEFRFVLRNGVWYKRNRVIYFSNGETREYYNMPSYAS